MGNDSKLDSVTAIDHSIEARWATLDTRAEAETGDESEDAYHMGIRDGFEMAVALIDMMTGGDGEYRFCANPHTERHCPDPAFMIRKIVERFPLTTQEKPS